MILFKSQTRKPGEWMAFTNRLDNDHTTRLHLTLSIFMFASFLVFLPAWLIDTRVLDSALVWTKPQKFNISLGLHFLTIAVLMQLVPREVRNGPVLIIFSYLAAISLVFEYVWVSTQAAKGVRSHFNFDSGFEAMMYALMGLGAFFLMTIALALAVQIWRKGDRSQRGLCHLPRNRRPDLRQPAANNPAYRDRLDTDRSPKPDRGDG